MKEDLDVLLKWKLMHQLQTGEFKVSTIDAEKIMQMALRGYSSGLKCVGHVSFTGVSLQEYETNQGHTHTKRGVKKKSARHIRRITFFSALPQFSFLHWRFRIALPCLIPALLNVLK